MSNSTQQPPERQPVPYDKKVVNQAAKLEGRSMYRRVCNGRLYVPPKKDGSSNPEGAPRLTVERGIGLPGLFRSVIGSIIVLGKRLFPVPVIHLRNDLPKDERGFRPPVGFNILKAAYNSGWVIFGGKHMFPLESMKVVARTFRKAVDAAAYLRGLAAPTIGKGRFKNQTLVFKDITSVDSDGNVMHAGCDGSGRIHPDHPIFQTLGSVCPIQVRIWSPTRGLFDKGILVPDERCVKDGNPIIWIDWLQTKGNMKGDHKSKCGLESGAFDPKTGVLVDESLLNEEIVEEGCLIGVLQKWDRHARGIKWCFEILERVQNTGRNQEIVTNMLKESLAEFAAKGGVRGILERLAEEDPKLQMVVKVCSRVSVLTGRDFDPLRIPYVWNYVQDDLQRKLYHFRQGAGQRSMRFVAVLDNAVPPGHTVMQRVKVDDEWRFQHGDEVATTRFPMILPQALKVLKVINPSVGRKWSHLSHLLIKTERGVRVPKCVMYFNEHDLVGGLQGDDDGDTVLCDWRPDVIELFKNRVSLLPGKADATFLIEPGKAAKNWKTEEPLLKEDGTMSDNAIRIVGMDGRGPVGQLTYYGAMFLALNKRMHALACSVLIQEAIDSGKHVVLLSDPNELVKPSNWCEVRPDVFEPRDCKAEIDGRWYDESGCLDMKEFGKWVKAQTRTREYPKGLKMKNVLTWRGDEGAKKTREDTWSIVRSPGENLVHWCNASAYMQWTALREEMIDLNHSDVELASILPLALGLPESVCEPSDYELLRQRSGLVAFGKNLSSIINSQLEPEDRAIQIDAQHELLRVALSALTVEEVLLIWCTELHLAKEGADGKRPKHWANNMNRAFRAVCFSDHVLDALGIEMEETSCQFMAGMVKLKDGRNRSVLDICMDVLVEAVKTGQEASIFTAGANWATRFDEAHELRVGGSAKGCQHCQRVIHSKVANFVRNKQEKLDKGFTAAVGKTCGDINRILREESNES